MPHVFYSLLLFMCLCVCVFKITLYKNASPGFFFLCMIQLNPSPRGGLFLNSIPTGGFPLLRAVLIP